MLLKLLRLAKSPRNVTPIIIILIVVICTAHFKPDPFSISEKADSYYSNQILSVKEELTSLKVSCEKKSPLKLLRQKFISSRIHYKKLAVFSEYLNPYETKFLNGPALNRAEDGTPDIIIPPQGFQAIEEILFSDPEPDFHAQVCKRLEEMLTILKRLENETDRIYKFREELIWDAMRTALVRVVALGITGYDSPIAQNSLPESKASLEGIKEILALFRNAMNAKSPGATEKLTGLLDNATGYISQHNNFNSFDRLAFISGYTNPIYKELSITRLRAGISIPNGRSPVNFNAQSIFQKDFFDVNFFSPGSEYWITDKRIELGKKLFSDPIISGTKNRSCASCHSPEKAFTDGMQVPLSIDNKTPLSRNTPTLWNSTLQTRLFFDNRTDILENQLKEVVHNTDEMKGSLAESAAELKKLPEYLQYFKAAYATEKEPISAYNIANAISSYVRSLTSLDSKFDQYMLGEQSKLTVSEKNGFNLFSGKAKCATCHFIPLYNGLVPPDFTETETEVLGVPETNSKSKARLGVDLGRYLITNSAIHKYSFKTPTLRNIELTAPYMHNGVFSTLEEVMDFYNEGGGKGLKIAPENQTLPKEKLNLTKKEMTEIIAFMKALTDPAVKHY